jgi:hypothetical protein
MECNWVYNNIDKYLLENHERGLFDTSLKGTSVHSVAYVIVHTMPQTSIKVKVHFVYEVCVAQPTTKRKWRYYHMYYITMMIGYMWYKYLNLGHLCKPKSINVFFYTYMYATWIGDMQLKKEKRTSCRWGQFDIMSHLFTVVTPKDHVHLFQILSLALPPHCSQGHQKWGWPCQIMYEKVT